MIGPTDPGSDELLQFYSSSDTKRFDIEVNSTDSTHPDLLQLQPNLQLQSKAGQRLIADAVAAPMVACASQVSGYLGSNVHMYMPNPNSFEESIHPNYGGGINRGSGTTTARVLHPESVAADVRGDERDLQ